MLKRLKQGQIVVLISDAGTPGISDPGAELVRILLHYASSFSEHYLQYC